MRCGWWEKRAPVSRFPPARQLAQAFDTIASAPRPGSTPAVQRLATPAAARPCSPQQLPQCPARAPHCGTRRSKVSRTVPHGSRAQGHTVRTAGVNPCVPQRRSATSRLAKPSRLPAGQPRCAAVGGWYEPRVRRLRSKACRRQGAAQHAWSTNASAARQSGKAARSAVVQCNRGASCGGRNGGMAHQPAAALLHGVQQLTACCASLPLRSSSRLRVTSKDGCLNRRGSGGGLQDDACANALFFPLAARPWRFPLHGQFRGPAAAAACIDFAPPGGVLSLSAHLRRTAAFGAPLRCAPSSFYGKQGLTANATWLHDELCQASMGTVRLWAVTCVLRWSTSAMRRPRTQAASSTYHVVL